MRHFALVLSVIVSLYAIVLLVSIAIESERTAERVVSGSMAIAYGIILVGSIAAALKRSGKGIARMVAVACASVPMVWLIGCLDAGMISSMELSSALTISITVVFQWFVYQAYRSRNEA
jgi:hypothetical protein